MAVKKIKLLGLIGWRGMVGSVLMRRMVEENDFDNLELKFFSTSNPKGTAHLVLKGDALQNSTLRHQDFTLGDAYDVQALSRLDAIISTQGGHYTKRMHPLLRKAGWQGYWIDAASTLRMEKDAIIVLDPVNENVIKDAIFNDCKNLIGGNCTVSLMLLALKGLFQNDLIEWITSHTYQAASGAGAKLMRELFAQMVHLTEENSSLLQEYDVGKKSILDLDEAILHTMKSVPNLSIGKSLACNVLPWIDVEMSDEWQGSSREEWKGAVEANKILQTPVNHPIAIDSICVRVPTMRSHSQAFTIKLKKDVPIRELESLIAESHEWIQFVPNTKDDTLSHLTPEAISNTLKIAIGRLKKLKIGANYIGAFSVGDQLLWGAAEPIRRALLLLKNQ